MDEYAENSRKIIVRDNRIQELTIEVRGEKVKVLDSPIEELIKGVKDLQFRFAKQEKFESLSQ